MSARGAYSRRSIKTTPPAECSREEAVGIVKQHLDKLKPKRMIGTTELAHELHLDPALLSKLKDELWQYVTDTGKTKGHFGRKTPVYVWHSRKLDRQPPHRTDRADIAAKVSALLDRDPAKEYSTADVLTAALERKPTTHDFNVLNAAVTSLGRYWRYGPPRPGRGQQTSSMVRHKIWSGNPDNRAAQHRADIARLEATLASERQKLSALENPAILTG
jgi:hypothetical protein